MACFSELYVCRAQGRVYGGGRRSSGLADGDGVRVIQAFESLGPSVHSRLHEPLRHRSLTPCSKAE